MLSYVQKSREANKSTEMLTEATYDQLHPKMGIGTQKLED